MQKTKVIMILDKSGSMASTANQAVGTRNQQIEENRWCDWRGHKLRKAAV